MFTPWLLEEVRSTLQRFGGSPSRRALTPEPFAVV